MPDGRVYVIAGGNDGWLSLSGISFPVISDRTPDLLNNWVDFGGGYAPSAVNKIGYALCFKKRVHNICKPRRTDARILEVGARCPE